MSKKINVIFKNIYTAIFPGIVFIFSYLYRIALDAFQNMESNFHIFIGISLAIILLIPYIMPFSIINSSYATPLLIFNMLFVCLAVYVFFFVIRKSNGDF